MTFILYVHDTLRCERTRSDLSHEPLNIEYNVDSIDIHLSHVKADLSHEPLIQYK